MQTQVSPLNDANRLGLNYRAQAAGLGYRGPIIDAHVHISGVAAARRYFEVAGWFGVEKVWSQSPLEEVDALRDALGDRLEFVIVPNYSDRTNPDAFGADWLRRIEKFAAKGAKIIKFWSAPRGRDLSPFLRLDHPIRLEAMKMADALGLTFMVHIADPDTWFATTYKDPRRYGTKASQYEPLERLLDQYRHVNWLAAHMAGDPERLSHLQDLLDRHPNLYLDTSATKWMVRELSKRPGEFRAFCQRNPGRVLWGTDLVVNASQADTPETYDHYASRFWALRTLVETDYDGPSPIVDPDLQMVNPSVSKLATARLRGANMDPATLEVLYCRAARSFLDQARARFRGG